MTFNIDLWFTYLFVFWFFNSDNYKQEDKVNTGIFVVS